MKICDCCNCETDKLLQLVPEFDNMEVCGGCFDRLTEQLTVINAKIARIRTRARQRAFREWKGADPIPVKVKRAYGMVRSLMEILFHQRN